MEKVMRISWSDIFKVTLVIATIATAWGIQQAKIVDLEKGRDVNRHNIELLSERMRLQEIYIAQIKEQTTQIQSDVKVIKDYLINTGLSHR